MKWLIFGNPLFPLNVTLVSTTQQVSQPKTFVAHLLSPTPKVNKEKLCSIVNAQTVTSINCPANSSWALRKIFECSQIIISASGWDRFIKKGSFSIKEMYKHLHGDFVKVSWNRVLCQNLASPRSLFILWLAMHNRLFLLELD